MSDWLKDFVSDRREMFGFLVPDDYEKRVYHPNSKLFFSVYHTGLDEL
jgi:hypothetical protein